MPLTYSDVIMALAAIVVYAGMYAGISRAISDIQAVADPMTSVIAAMIPMLVLVALLLSTGVASRS